MTTQPEPVYATAAEAEASAPRWTLAWPPLPGRGVPCPYCTGPVASIAIEVETREGVVRYVMVTDEDGAPLFNADGEPELRRVQFADEVVRYRAAMRPCGCVWDSAAAGQRHALELAWGDTGGDGAQPLAALRLVAAGSAPPDGPAVRLAVQASASHV